jgi:antirestriction protein ArdC
MPIDIYQSITDKIITQLEDPNGLGQWSCPWYRAQLAEMPRSADGRPYNGINTLVLWCAATERNYLSPVWGTYRQWLKHGCQVRRGEKAEMVVFYKHLEKFNNDTQEIDQHRLARAFFVFNSQQVDGYQAPAVPQELDATERVIQAEDYFAAIGAEIKVGGDRAFYSPSSDFIGMPPYERFKDGYHYYATLGHEHIHWTGHQSRLNRELQSSRFGSEAYAFEELVAELGSAFLCCHIGIDNEPRIDHAKYLNAWLKVLRSDKKAIFTAASKAQKAVDYLNAYQPGSSEAEAELDNTNVP